jgi:FtsP/CotA-like multicopper oxidase with cupredoxin domain
MKRPQFLTSVAAAGAALCTPAVAASEQSVSLEIRKVAWTVRPGQTVNVAAYNGVVPGPLLRVTEGDRLSVSVQNRTADLQSVHWHGLVVSDRVDGVIELGTPPVPANGSRNYQFTATPGGTRWYHAHTNDGLFSGMFGPLIVDRKGERGDYDREVVLVLHEFGERIETISPMASAATEATTLAAPANNMGGMMGGGMMGMMGPMAVARYTVYAVNGKALGTGEPIRVRAGERVRFRIINASATLTHRLALPGHRFLVTELDGNPIPKPRVLDAIELGVAERIDAIVAMTAPGVWILGSTDPDARSKGLGIVVAYDGRSGPAQWRDEARDPFAYGMFANANRSAHVDAVFDFHLEKAPDGPDRWMINGEEFPNVHPLDVQHGKTYLLRFSNESTMEHPIHTHGHSFELARIDGISISGVVKDTIVIRPMGGQAEILLKANNPYAGRFLLHCHNEQHMDGGLATVIRYES